MDTAFNGNKTIKSENLTLKKQGQIAIPKHFLEKLDLHENDQLEVTVEDGKIIMQPVIKIDKEQAWFWSFEWQQGEREAESDISNDKINTFNDTEDAIEFLRSNRE